MTRANFTVITKKGERWCANHLSVTRASRVSPDGTFWGSYSVLSFVCSGELVCIDASDVERVEWSPVGASWCSECDGSLYAIVGVDDHANPWLQPKGESE